MTDASFSGFGFVLVQAAKYDNKHQPIKFDLIMAGSRSMKDVETWYSVSEIEAVALNWSLNKCSHFLKGAPKTEVWVDHNPLIGTCPNQLFAWTLGGWEQLRWVIKRLILTCRRRDESSSLLLQVYEPFYNSPQLFPTTKSSCKELIWASPYCTTIEEEQRPLQWK